MKWVKENVNYWENPDCPTDYLRGALVRLVSEVEGVNLPINYFNNRDRKYLSEKIAFYEEIADK